MIRTRLATGHSFVKQPLGFFKCSGCEVTASPGDDEDARRFPTCLLYGIEVVRRRRAAQQADPLFGGAA